MTKIALAQINTTVGDLAGNTQKIRTAIKEARSVQADIILFPEMAVLGYPPRDLLCKEHLVKACETMVHELAGEFSDSPELLLVIPTPRSTGRSVGTGVTNSIALARGGEIVQWYDKRLLPTYDVFDEKRYFDPGQEPGVIEHAGQRIGITICEDLWIHDADVHAVTDVESRRRLYAEDTLDDLKALGIDLLLNASASPYRLGIPTHRRNLFHHAAQRAGVPLAFTNLVGGNDDLIFDGNSGVVTPDNAHAFELPGFREACKIVDLNQLLNATASPVAPASATETEDADLNDIFYALTLGIRDYLHKCRFHDVWIALSGGIDSAIVAALAVAAIGPEHVRGLGLPSRYSSDGSVTDAEQLAKNLKIPFDVIPIEPAHEVMTEALAKLFAESTNPPGVAEENIQARIRGNIMMALSNKFGALLLTTGNKSEIAVGYCTLYGDMAGGLAVISDLPKTMVYRLAHYLNDHAEALGFVCAPIPADTLTKPPSAELRPDQKDQDTLPPYAILDEIIQRYVELLQSEIQIMSETGFDPATVGHICKLIDRNEYKRRQMPTGLKVTTRAFGSGWRMPIAAQLNGYS